MKKSKTKCIQFLPYITLNKERIPPVKLEKEFTFLGKDFDFSKACGERKTEVKSKALGYILVTNKILPENRCESGIVQRYVF